MLLPINNLLINHCMMTSTTKVLINNLMNDNIFTMNLTRQYVNAQIMRIIIPNRDQKVALYLVHQSRI